MKILVPIDGSKNSMKAVKAAADIASSKKDDVYLMTVIPFIPGIDLEISAKEMNKLESSMRNRGEGIIKKAQKVLSAKKIKAKTIVSTAVSAADEILDVAGKRKIHLIIIGSQGIGGAATRFFMGSVASKVVSHAPCSVYLVKIS
jgi:nucleotide-binding universal stress UspA family protein